MACYRTQSSEKIKARRGQATCRASKSTSSSNHDSKKEVRLSVETWPSKPSHHYRWWREAFCFLQIRGIYERKGKTDASTTELDPNEYRLWSWLQENQLLTRQTGGLLKVPIQMLKQQVENEVIQFVFNNFPRNGIKYLETLLDSFDKFELLEMFLKNH